MEIHRQGRFASVWGRDVEGGEPVALKTVSFKPKRAEYTEFGQAQPGRVSICNEGRKLNECGEGGAEE